MLMFFLCFYFLFIILPGAHPVVEDKITLHSFFCFLLHQPLFLVLAFFNNFWTAPNPLSEIHFLVCT